MGRIEQIGEEIGKLETEAEHLQIEIEKIDDVAHMDDPTVEMGAVKPICRRTYSNCNGAQHRGINGRTKAGLQRSELPSLTMVALRDAGKPLTSREIASEIIAKRPELNEKTIRGRVQAFLNTGLDKFVRRVGERDGSFLYEVNR